MKKELLLSGLLFAIGLGFFMGFKGAFQQTFAIAVGIIFIALPAYLKTVELLNKLFKTKKQHRAAL